MKSFFVGRIFPTKKKSFLLEKLFKKIGKKNLVKEIHMNMCPSQKFADYTFSLLKTIFYLLNYHILYKPSFLVTAEEYSLKECYNAYKANTTQFFRDRIGSVQNNLCLIKKQEYFTEINALQMTILFFL